MKFDFYIPYRIKDFYYSIRNFVKPPQWWLIKKLLGGWRDKDSIFWIVISESIINFVEKEISKKSLFDKERWSDISKFGNNYIESCQNQIKFEEELKDIYSILTKRLPELNKELELAWEKVPKITFQNAGKQDFKRHIFYRQVEGIEEEIKDLQKQIMEWAISQKDYFWT